MSNLTTVLIVTHVLYNSRGDKLNSTIEVLTSRTSLRKYDQKEISKEHLDIILECAMRAPTAGNMMLYSIIVIKDRAKKDTLSKTCDNQPFIATAPVVLVFTADYKKTFDYYKLSNVKEFCEGKGEEFVGPTHADLLLSSCDANIAAQNAVIAAEALGIGSCYIGDIMENYEKHRELLNLPDFVFPVSMLCLGYYPEGTKRTIHNRFDRKYVVFNENYNSLSNEEIKDMYKQWDARFSEKNTYGAKNYGQLHYAFKTGAAFAKEMTRSVNEALKIWSGMKL